MRQYQGIWIRLKQKGTISLSADRRLHPRIIKAVTKEKYNDVVYKYELGENAQAAKLSHRSEGAKLTFTLTKTIGLSDL
jgi:hypothetical protein